MPITSIFHISDIHIRKGDSVRSREQEYTEVFQNLFQQLKQFKEIITGSALIVVTGDIFHDKDLNSPCGEELIGTLLQGLAATAPTVIIRGNHDYRQDKPLEKDLITPHCKSIENLHYFNETGCYEIENIGIGLVAIQDALLPNATSGIVRTLPPFPDPSDFSEAVTHRLALFHGSISHARLENGTTYDSPEGYPLDWFKEYDMVLLGDIHLQQVNKAAKHNSVIESGPFATRLNTYAIEKGTWGYPGSLIQQKSSELLLGHGLLHWDLQNKKVTEYHIHNRYGIVTMSQAKESLLVTLQKDVQVPLETVVTLPWFPTHIQVRVQGKCNAELLDTIRTRLQECGKIVLGICESSLKPVKHAAAAGGPAETEELDVTVLNSPDTWEQFILGNCKNETVQKSSTWRTWLTKPGQLLIPTENIPEQLIKGIQTYNDSIHKSVELYTKELDSHVTNGRNSMSLVQIEWSWLFNFGPDNHYNFEDMVSKLVVLNAKNGHGKSNFFEVICISLFGDGFPSRDNDNYSAAILNNRMPEGAQPTTRITFELNKVQYVLERVFKKEHGKDTILNKSIALRLVPSGEVVKEGVKAVKEWIATSIGDKRAFLSSCMLTQDGDCNFFSSPKVEQKRLIDNIFSLNGVQRLEGLLKEANRCYKGAKGLLEAYLAGYMMKKAKAKGDADKVALEEEAETLQGLLLELEQQIQETHDDWSSYSPKTFTGTTLETYQAQLHQLPNGTKVADIDKLRGDLQSLKGIVKGPVEEAAKPEGAEIEFEGLGQKIRGFKEELSRLKGPVGTVGTMSTEECRRLLEDYRIWLAGWKREPGWPFESGGKVDEKAYKKLKELVQTLEESGRPSGTIRPGLEAERARLKGVLKGLRSETELDALIERLAKDAREYPETERRCNQASKDIQDCQHLIDQHASLPFNPTCDACKAQPWRPALEDAKKRIGVLKEERKKLQKAMGVFDELYETEAEIRTLLGAATKELTLLKTSALDLVAVENGLEASEWQQTFNKAKKEFEELEAIQKTQVKTVQYRKEESEWSVQSADTVATLRTHLQQDIGLYEGWLAYHTYQMSKEVERLGICITGHQDAVKREDLEGKIAAFPAWTLEQTLGRQKGDAEAGLQRAQDQLDQLNAGAEDEVAQEALRVIEIRQELLAHLSDAFKGYREWLYRNKLGPLIQEAVNELLVNICDGRPLSLEPEWLPAIDTFSWFLRDGVSRTIIEKASGFQRFITGMAMRVAMSRLGIAGQTLYENLIIDEGFTACDGENLEKVPAFLKALIADQKYKGVVLATHLEELKACGDKQISIERDGISGISALRAGAVRIVLPNVVEKAKRGKKKVGGA